MNESYKTEGIIIGKKDFFESDKILTIFTKDFGKIKVKAVGVRKILAKMAGHLEMFNHVKLDLVKGRNFYIVTGAQTIESFSGLKEDFDRISVLYYISEVLDRVLEEDVRHKNTFSFLLSAINRLKQKNVNFSLLMAFFELNTLSILGFKPELLSCVGCREKIGGHNFFFSHERGGILCESCGNEDFFATPISPEALGLIQLVVNRDYDHLEKIRLEENSIKEIKKISSFFLEHILGRELKSKQFINF